MKDYCKNWNLLFQTKEELDEFLKDNILEGQATLKPGVK